MMIAFAVAASVYAANSCESLKSISLTDTTIIAAETVAAGA